MKRLILLCVALLLVGASKQSAGKIARVWTSADGKKITGTLADQGDDWVKIKIKDKIKINTTKNADIKERRITQNICY